jgi:ABC-2 type transport system ATP-binding protein
VALVGPNGAGKTTLLEIITGLVQPSTGDLSVLGLEAGSMSALKKIAFVAQNAPLYRSQTINALVAMTEALNATFDRTFAIQRLKEFEIPLTKKVGNLSGGQQAQVALTLAIARHPELLVLDEPTASLDPLARQEFVGHLMREVAEDGLSVIFSSHSLVDLERVADYLVLLTNGEVQLAETMDEALRSHKVVQCPPGELDRIPGLEIVNRQFNVRFGSHLVRLRDETGLATLHGHDASLEDVVIGYISRAQQIQGLEDKVAL